MDWSTWTAELPDDVRRKTETLSRTDDTDDLPEPGWWLIIVWDHHEDTRTERFNSFDELRRRIPQLGTAVTVIPFYGVMCRLAVSRSAHGGSMERLLQHPDGRYVPIEDLQPRRVLTNFRLSDPLPLDGLTEEQLQTLRPEARLDPSTLDRIESDDMPEGEF